MKVTIVHPRWYEEHNLIKRIMDDVFGEGGDGWGWIQTDDPHSWANKVYHKLLEHGFDATIVNHHKDGCINVGIYQEGWTFSKDECMVPECYDVMYKIE